MPHDRVAIKYWLPFLPAPYYLELLLAVATVC
jgi:hypothetical protein